MGKTITKGYAFTSTETVTNVKLATLVDDATITKVTDADGDTAIDTELTSDVDEINLKCNGTVQVKVTDGTIAPITDNDIDLGTTTKEFKDLFIDGTANIDSLVADTADINGGSIDGATLGGSSAVTITDMDCNGGSIDGVTIGAAAAPTVTDLGTVTTCNIDGGTLDGVNIGTTTATGELIVNNASDAADGLGSQGTSGEVLTSAGTGANPTWATPAGGTFGSWANATIGSSTQASTDGILMYIATQDGGGSAGLLSIKTDSANPPTVVRAQDTIDNVNSKAFMCCPVKKSEYYLISEANVTGSAAYLLPLGT